MNYVFNTDDREDGNVRTLTLHSRIADIRHPHQRTSCLGGHRKKNVQSSKCEDEDLCVTLTIPSSHVMLPVTEAMLEDQLDCLQ